VSHIEAKHEREIANGEKLTGVRQLVLERKKIEAIREYRELTNVDLKDAEYTVEEMEYRLLEESPEKFTPEKVIPKGKGCGASAAVVCVLAAAGVYWIVRR